MTLMIGDKTVVSLHYKLSDDDGNVIDSSDADKPLAYLHGAGNIVPGLENALFGKTEGNSLSVRVEPAEGYGEVLPELIQPVDRAAFQGVDKVEAGMAFEAQAPDGTAQRIVVTAVDGDQVTIDANHPLAGIALNFEVEIVSVRAASDEELSHGHVH